MDKIPQLVIQLWLQFGSGRGLPQLLTSASIAVLDPGSDSLGSTDWTDLSNPSSGDQDLQIRDLFCGSQKPFILQIWFFLSLDLPFLS